MSMEQELNQLKRQVSQLQSRLAHYEGASKTRVSSTLDPLSNPISIVVVGASGDLAKKKTFPALFSLHVHGLLPSHTKIVGFARTAYSDPDFRAFISKNLKGDEAKKKEFLERLSYVKGQYDSTESFAAVDAHLQKSESQTGNRIFYLAIPPTIFHPVATSIRAAAVAPNGWTRIVVEKPFGRDLESSNLLSEQLAHLFSEEEIFRIDHYLGKELVQNLMGLRFANSVFEPLWNRLHIRNVTITFKEDIGTEGRGGYFDEFGIIRDVMQNHLMQVFALVAMEPPVTLSAEDVRDEKVKLLRAVRPIVLDDVVVGQYGRSPDGSKESYLDDKTVPKGSLTPTYATAVLHINNSRWLNVPFFLKCGKGLNERKAEIRIQYEPPPTHLYSKNPPPNELVIRLQPNEAVYLKLSAKRPGLSDELDQMELDITYKDRFAVNLPDAYERLIYDVIRGDHNLFVRDDELKAAWKIFTPLLHRLESEKVAPTVYPFGSRGPPQSDELLNRYGFIRTEGYVWGSRVPTPTPKTNL